MTDQGTREGRLGFGFGGWWKWMHGMIDEV